MGLRCSAGSRAACREAAGFIDSLSAPSHAAGNGTLSQFDMHDSSEDAGMQKATDSKAQDRSETREQWSKLPFSSLLKAWLDCQEVETQIKLQTCKAGRGFPAGRFPCRASPMVLCGQRDSCRVCSNSYFPLPMDLSGRKDTLDPADIAPQHFAKSRNKEQVLSGATRICLCFSQESRSQGRRGSHFPALLLKMYLTKAMLVTKHSASPWNSCREGLLSKPFKPTLC